ncbi:MAG: fumarylacetoacetase [Caulobacteraceae bacterium]|nr:fumarylacetoacetase [Caulobacter sp.]
MPADTAAGLDRSHDPARRSWVASADGHAEFPIQNLPHGVFSVDGAAPRGGVAIGDEVLDLAAAVEAGLFAGDALDAARAAAASTLNGWMALEPSARQALRLRLSDLLAQGAPDRERAEPLLRPASSVHMHLPAAVGDYTDFYAGIHHALTVGKQFRPDNPLLPNYKWVPIGYHGRASSVRVSGEPVRRPSGQRKPPEAEAPVFGPSRRLDYELEVGLWVGRGNAPGEPIPIGQAGERIVGLCLLNDWSARDLQGWEYQPLGPFLAKSFATTVSPWVVTAEALAPFRTAQPARPEGDPRPLPYLCDEADQARGAFAVELEVWLQPQGAAAPSRLSASAMTDMYWTPAQLLAHHASNGCDLRPGDLLGTGTISGPRPEQGGSLLELSQGGKAPVALEGGVRRAFLEDGDEVILRAHASREGFAPIGLGECRARVTAAG